MSDGSRSGVAWMRANSQSSERASDLASIVLPTPGKSSRMRWPSHSSAITHRSSRPSGAWITRATLSITRRAMAPALVIAWDWVESCSSDASTGVLSSDRRTLLYGGAGGLVPQCVQNGCGAGLFGASRYQLLSLGRHQHDFVEAAVKADVATADVVHHDHVGALAFQLGVGPLDCTLAVLGREADQHLALAPPGAQLGQDVGCRLQLDRPGTGVLDALAVDRLGRPVVGHGGGH